MNAQWRLVLFGILPCFCSSLSNLMMFLRSRSPHLLPLGRDWHQFTGIFSAPASTSRATGILGHCFVAKKLALFSASSSQSAGSEKKIAIRGGGLAGLSVALHLLEKTTLINSNRQQQHGRPLSVTLLDCAAAAGLGGASAVAGGLVHPLSPQGKLVHWGREGLEETSRLVRKASASSDSSSNKNGDKIVLRDELYRLAVNAKQENQLQRTASSLTDIAEWLDRDETVKRLGGAGTAVKSVLGALRLHSGCQVIHVPAYLRGLWRACEREAALTGSTVEWKQIDTNKNSGKNSNVFDVTVYCAGGSTLTIEKLKEVQASNTNRVFPVQLVRGQSLELHAPTQTNEPIHLSHALLCGKYISPLPCQSRILIGATHEFQMHPLSREEVVAELKERTAPFFPWNASLEVDRLTSGVRVQSARGRTGRRPIVGRLSETEWIFTGLSSRGLLYHGIYGNMLAEAILADNENVLLEYCPDIFWWRRSEV